MKVLFFSGLGVLVLGIVLLVVPIPRSERGRISIGGVALGVEARRQERVHPALGALLILGGLAAMAAGKGKSTR